MGNNKQADTQRYFIHLAYKGTAYRGYQRQDPTLQIKCVQDLIEENLNKMTKSKISFMGCGRTDVGVHAMQYFGHFDWISNWDFDPIDRMNRMLPNDIRMYEMIPVERHFHARYDAIERTYEYHLHLEENPFISQISTFYRTEKIDFELLRWGVEHFATLKDFKHLCLTPDKFQNTHCHMYEASVHISPDQKKILFRFKANRFLKSMIRLMVARLLALGEGFMTKDEFIDVTRNNQHFDFRTLAFPQGLFLTKVVYPYLEREIKGHLVF